MKQPFLVGKSVYLRPLDTKDLDGPYLSWLNDRETTRFLETGRFPSTRQELEAYTLRGHDGGKQVLLAIIDRANDRHIGTIKLGPIDWIHRRGSIGLLIGEPSARGKGYGREAVQLLTAYAFGTLNLHKVTAGAHADHEASIALFTGLGFSVEGRQREQCFREGAYRDIVLMGWLRHEARPARRAIASGRHAARR